MIYSGYPNIGLQMKYPGALVLPSTLPFSPQRHREIDDGRLISALCSQGTPHAADPALAPSPAAASRAPDSGRLSDTLGPAGASGSRVSLGIGSGKGYYRVGKGGVPGDVDVRHGCIGVEGGAALGPLGGVAVEALALEKTGDGGDVGCRGRHCLEGILGSL